jgi:hypothetical protein
MASAETPRFGRKKTRKDQFDRTVCDIRTLIDCRFEILVPKHNAVKNTKLSISIVSHYLKNRCSPAD